jgi:hypothetical protein
MTHNHSHGTAKGHEDKLKVMTTTERLVREFDPVKYSIDTWCLHHLGDVTQPDSKPENVFIQQVVYGWYRERRVLDAFIKNFYADNASRLLRSGMTMYTVLAYLAMFRLDELGFVKFKEYALTQDPSKVFNFASYLFNKVLKISYS